MDGAMHHLTPTQIKAHERSKAFRARIDTLALRLKVGMEAPVPKIVEEPKPEPEPEPERPSKPLWFSMVTKIQPEPRNFPSIAKIQEVVGDHFSVTVNDLKSACRAWRVAHPRMIAVYLCRELTPMSFPQIGRRFGGRDHTTALHSHRKIQNRIAGDAILAAEISKLKEALA